MPGEPARPPHALPDRLDRDPAPDHAAVAASGRRQALARGQALRVPAGPARGRPDHAADARLQHLRATSTGSRATLLRRRPVRGSSSGSGARPTCSRSPSPAVSPASPAPVSTTPTPTTRCSAQVIWMVTGHSVQSQIHRTGPPRHSACAGPRSRAPGVPGTAPPLLHRRTGLLRGRDLLEPVVDDRRRHRDERHDRRRRPQRPRDGYRRPDLPAAPAANASRPRRRGSPTSAPASATASASSSPTAGASRTRC